MSLARHLLRAGLARSIATIAAVRVAIAAVYVIGAVIEFIGLLLTISVIIGVEPHDGRAEIRHPRGWEKWRGPAVIAVGIIIGLAANIASLWAK